MRRHEYIVSSLNQFGESLTFAASAYFTESGATVTWSAVPGANAYKIYRGVKSEIFQNVATVSGNMTSWMDRESSELASGSGPASIPAKADFYNETLGEPWSPQEDIKVDYARVPKKTYALPARVSRRRETIGRWMLYLVLWAWATLGIHDGEGERTTAVLLWGWIRKIDPMDFFGVSVIVCVIGSVFVGSWDFIREYRKYKMEWRL